MAGLFKNGRLPCFSLTSWDGVGVALTLCCCITEQHEDEGDVAAVSRGRQFWPVSCEGVFYWKADLST